MNEIRDLMIGIDFGREYTQLCYYDRKAEEARSVSMKVGTNLYEAPTCLCRRTQGDYCVGLEAEYFVKEKKGEMIDGLYELSGSNEKVQAAGEEKEPWEILSYFLEGILKFLGILDVEKNTRCLSITMPELNQERVENFQKACKSLGFEEKKFILMDYRESFYYYVLSQKRETWNRSVAWYDFEPDKVHFLKLTISGTARPALVKLESPAETPLSETAEERDFEFSKFIHKTLEKELFSSIQITGRGFAPQWASQSVKILCYQKRKVFYGNNLFAKGACLAAVERLEQHRLKGYRYFSESLVTKDVGMEMRIMGSPAYHPLIEAGKNWYECKNQCEFILDDVKELVFVVGTMGETEKKRVAMGLPGVPSRPNKTTRIRLSLRYISPAQCEVTAEDMGFGEMYPSSGKVWKELVQW